LFVTPFECTYKDPGSNPSKYSLYNLTSSLIIHLFLSRDFDSVVIVTCKCKKNLTLHLEARIFLGAGRSVLLTVIFCDVL
jgi:hypothetical protein